MKYITYIMVGFSIALFSCVNGKKQQTSNYAFKAISEQKLIGPVEYIYNNDSSYVLALVEKKGTPLQPQNNIRFIVHDLTADEVVYEDVLDNGSVSFLNDHELKIVRIPGIMKEGHTLANHTQIYNLKTKEKRLLSEQ